MKKKIRKGSMESVWNRIKVLLVQGEVNTSKLGLWKLLILAMVADLTNCILLLTTWFVVVVQVGFMT